jgi:TRAP-type C4-dicarboxylate transport system permease small subunit
MMRLDKRRGLVFLVLYCVLFLISLGVVAFGLVMLKIAYDLHHPTEFIAVFFAASLVILIGGAMALGFGLRVVERLRKKAKKIENNP